MSKAQENAAFPGYTMDMDTKRVSFQEGMALRDYFAAKAMQALLGCAEWRANLDDENNSPSEFTAFSAYEMADAMLKARKEIKPTKPKVETTYVERRIPEHLEFKAHRLLDTFLVEHGYNPREL